MVSNFILLRSGLAFRWLVLNIHFFVLQFVVAVVVDVVAVVVLYVTVAAMTTF